ncbi:hypothetical protein NDU88_004652 [Pleurodeles waltl]|uniref:Uncharacterized protein n=1 Tax=Pleurodeles waltl TaxID=8319 RepID=A0AAV7QCM1_PLEWA|nr:hypothetical protein NDU88_004652 [Pleurodeles waltl]
MRGSLEKTAAAAEWEERAGPATPYGEGDTRGTLECELCAPHSRERLGWSLERSFLRVKSGEKRTVWSAPLAQLLLPCTLSRCEGPRFAGTFVCSVYRVVLATSALIHWQTPGERGLCLHVQTGG